MEAQSRHLTQPAVQEGILEEEKGKEESDRKGQTGRNVDFPGAK